MNIGILDADLLRKKPHRFPNLASMKISGYLKEQGHNVKLITEYVKDTSIDKIYCSKVFSETEIPDLRQYFNCDIEYGGSGFYYDKATPLPYEIEHHMPDYHLYDDFVKQQLDKGISKVALKYYTDYSIGFTTRGCIRQCDFCINKNYTKVFLNSPIEEFLDPSRKKICLLDDNILAFSGWREIFKTLQETGKKFQYKQGLDERLLTDEKCDWLFNKSNYDGEFIFAFDNIEDKDIILKKIDLARKYTDKIFKFYVFCGFDRKDKWDKNFWEQDIFDLIERCRLLQERHCLPYIMRFNRYIESPYAGVYKTVAAWCNQPSFFKKKSLREFGFASGGARQRYIEEFERNHSNFSYYMDMKWQ